jgi:hypothetical protein
LKHAPSSGKKKDLPVNSEIGQVPVGDTDGNNDGELLGAPLGSLLGALLGCSDGVSLGVMLGEELGSTEGNDDGDGAGQVWKVTVSPYDPKIGLFGGFSVIRVWMSLVGRVGSSSKSNSPSYPTLGVISYMAKLLVDLKALKRLLGVVLNVLLVQSVLVEVSL